MVALAVLVFIGCLPTFFKIDIVSFKDFMPFMILFCIISPKRTNNSVSVSRKTFGYAVFVGNLKTSSISLLTSNMSSAVKFRFCGVFWTTYIMESVDILSILDEFNKYKSCIGKKRLKQLASKNISIY